MEGRYINTVNPGMKQHLTLCELEVDGRQSKNPPSLAGNTFQNGEVAINLSSVFLHVKMFLKIWL